MNEIVIKALMVCTLGISGITMFTAAGLAFVAGRTFLMDHPCLPGWMAGVVRLGCTLVAGWFISLWLLFCSCM